MINKNEVEGVFNLLLDHITVKPQAYTARKSMNLRQKFANLWNQIKAKYDIEGLLVFLSLYFLFWSIVCKILIPTDNTVSIICLFFILYSINAELLYFHRKIF